MENIKMIFEIISVYKTTRKKYWEIFQNNLLYCLSNIYFLFTVKFLREVTPYFRKASIISEVGWELQRAFLCPLGPGANVSPPAPRSPPRADTRYIPLQLTHLARNLKHQDPGKRYLPDQ